LPFLLGTFLLDGAELGSELWWSRAWQLQFAAFWPSFQQCSQHVVSFVHGGDVHAIEFAAPISWA